MKIIINYTFVLIWLVVLLVAFIFQGAVDLESKLSSILFFSLPFLWFSYFTISKILKNLSLEGDKEKTKKIIITIVLLLSVSNILFNRKKVSNSPTIVLEESAQFMDLENYKSGRFFKTRLTISALQFINLLPLGESSKNSILMIINLTREGELGLYFDAVFEKNNYCLNSINGYFPCIKTPYEEITKKYKLSSTFDILYLAVASKAIIKHKKFIKKEKNYSKKLSTLVAVNDLVEFSLKVLRKVEQDTTLSKVNFTYGYLLNKNSFFYELFQMINVSFLKKFSKKLKNTIEGAEPKIFESNGKDGEEEKISLELDRFEQLKKDVKNLKEDSAYDEQISNYEKAFKAKVKERNKKSSLEKFIFKLAMKSTNIM